MLDRFLIPLDPEQQTEQILPYVAMLATKLHQPSVLLSVISDFGDLHPEAGAVDAALAGIVEKRRARAQHYLDDVRGQLLEQDVATTTVVATGKAAEAIVATAQAEHSELIAMATHGRVGPERWFMGSVTDAVARTSTTPLLLVRPRSMNDAPPTAVSEVIVPLDGSPAAEAALPYATFIAQAFQAPVLLIRSLPLTWLFGTEEPERSDGSSLSPELIANFKTNAEDYLRLIAAKVRDTGLQVRTHLAQFASPALEIAGWAELTDGALIAMTTHGRSALGRTLLGSVADRVIRSSIAPVLLIRPEHD